jgi:hypothetical protein
MGSMDPILSQKFVGKWYHVSNYFNGTNYYVSKVLMKWYYLFKCNFNSI